MRGAASLLLGALALAGCAAGASALRPSVVWVNHDRAYVALPDSAVLEPGSPVRFTRRGKPIAAGTVTRVDQGEMAVVTLTSGTLAGVRNLRDLEVAAAPAPLAPASRLRVGLPSAARGTAFFACGRVELRAPGPEGAYRAGALDERTLQLVRDTSVALSAPWPDTLVTRWFDDAADQEIALERGEIDVAVFWPGELSAHMRRQPRWQGSPAGVRSRGVVAAVWPGGTPVDSSAIAEAERRVFAPLNQGLFRGDLQPLWASPAPAQGMPEGATSASPGVGFAVDASCPGRADLQRALDRLTPEHAAATAVRSRIVYLDARVSPSDAIHEAAAAALRRGPFEPAVEEAEARRVVPLFAIRCPVVSAPELRRYLRALGTDALADLIECHAGGGRP